MKIYYKDFVTGKTRWTNPKQHSVQEIQFMGRTIKAIIAYRKSDEIIIPEHALAPQSRHLLNPA